MGIILPIQGTPVKLSIAILLTFVMLIQAQNFPDRLNTIVSRSTVLADNAMEFWLSHGPDSQNGGFYSSLDEWGNPQEESKHLIQQSRYLWSCAYWYAQRDSSNSVKEVCKNQYDFIIRAFYNNGEPVHSVNANGTQTESWDKVTYAESFLIYGLSEYALAFGDATAGDQALIVFNRINSRSHDTQFKGYDQTRDDRIFTSWGEKGTNTHLHLLEAFTRLYDYTDDAAVKEKLNELLDIFRDHIIQADNYCGQGFWKNWEKVPEDTHISYGHDIETVWLLLEAVKSLGRMDETDLVAQIMAMGKRSADEGYDSGVGAYSYQGAYDGNRTNDTKTWWVQFEAMQGLWRLFEHYDDTTYVGNIETILTWLEGKQMNDQTHEWFSDVDNSGNPGTQRYTASEWKTNYHSMRGVINIPLWIEEYKVKTDLVLSVSSESGVSSDIAVSSESIVSSDYSVSSESSEEESSESSFLQESSLYDEVSSSSEVVSSSDEVISTLERAFISPANNPGKWIRYYYNGAWYDIQGRNRKLYR